MKEEYLKKEFWDRFPEATHFSEGDGGMFVDVFWKMNEKGTPVKVWVIYPDRVDSFQPNPDCFVCDNLIKRPESFPEDVVEENSEHNSTSYVPSVGEECLASCWNEGRKTGFQKVRFIAEDGDEMVFRWLHSGKVESNSKEYCAFKPLPKEPTIEEKMMEAWKRQSLDYCIDNWKTVTTLEEVFGFITKHYNLQEK